jgi:hypothetical protein
MPVVRIRTLRGKAVRVACKSNPVAATGAGSLRCESQIQQLVEAGSLGEAYRLAINHFEACGRDVKRVKAHCRPDHIARLIEERSNGESR